MESECFGSLISSTLPGFIVYRKNEYFISERRGEKIGKYKFLLQKSCYPIIEEYFIGKCIPPIDFPMKYSSIIG